MRAALGQTTVNNSLFLQLILPQLESGGGGLGVSDRGVGAKFSVPISFQFKFHRLLSLSLVFLSKINFKKQKTTTQISHLFNYSTEGGCGGGWGWGSAGGGGADHRGRQATHSM